jgi:hypothetical protein
MTPSVYVLVTNREPALAKTSSLVFESIRLGFPDARIVVYGNASPARDEIARRARETDAQFVGMTKEMTHADWLESMIGINTGPIAIVDPDVVFWERVQDWEFGDALLAGRYIQGYRDRYNHKMFTHPRLHPSFWWIPNASALWDAIQEIREPVAWSGGDLWKPFMQYAYRQGTGWGFWDTGAQLYAGLGHHMRAFDHRQLNAYDHLFCGSTPDIGPRLPGHAAIERGEIESVRGLWRVQQRYFERGCS